MNKECVSILQKIDNIDNENLLTNWIRYDAGSSNKDYFKCESSDGLKLQQVPEEYSQVLLELKSKAPKSYLEIGIANGGSWMTCSYFLRNSIEISHAVDNLSYIQAVNQKESEIKYIKTFLSKYIKDVKFFNSDSGLFLDSNTEKYDVIFIDGDHGYDGVKSDFIKSLSHINDKGMIIFHDIVSVGAPGVVKLWNEIKHNYVHKEFIASNTCGMGIIYF